MDEKKFRIFWLYEPKVHHKGMISYVRQAEGIFRDIYPTPSSPHLRKMPPTKLIDYDIVGVVLHENELLKRKLEIAIKSLTEISHESSTHESTIEELKLIENKMTRSAYLAIKEIENQ